MYWHCEICVKFLNEDFKNKHLGSKLHTSLVNSNIKRYVISNTNSNKIDDIKKIPHNSH